MDRRQFFALASRRGRCRSRCVGRPRTRARQRRKHRDVRPEHGACLTLDPARGAFTGYPAGYEAALCLYDRLLDFDADMKIVPQLATVLRDEPGSQVDAR